MSSLLVSGLDIRELAAGPGIEVLLPPMPLPALTDVKEATLHALDEPLDGLALTRRLRRGSKVTVVVDDLAFPVPMASKDGRGEMLEAIYEALTSASVASSQVTVLVANGLNRQYRPAEITEALGARITSQFVVRNHDVEDANNLVRLSDSPAGPVEVARAVVEADLVIFVNVVSMPSHAGLFSLAAGTVGFRTARFLNAPQHFAAGQWPLLADSSWVKAHDEVSRAITARAQVMQVSAVLNNELWVPTVASLLQSDEGISRPLQMWNALPPAVRQRASRSMRSQYRPLAVLAGSPDAVGPRALELFLRQHEITAEGEADILLFGLPDLGPFSIRSVPNPVLIANLALGYVAQLFTRAPLVKKGGVLIFLNPLTPQFDSKVHAPHEELYEKVLRLERESDAIAERYEAYLAGRPEYVSAYQRRFAFHPAHALMSWYQCTPMRKHVSRIICAHGDPRSATRLGFMPATGVEQALEKAKELLGLARPKVRVLELPPPFFVRV